MSVIKAATMKYTDGAMHPSYRLKQSIHCPSLSAMFNLLHSSMNQELFEKHLCNQGSYYKYCSMPKGTSHAESTSNSEKNQACTLSRC